MRRQRAAARERGRPAGPTSRARASRRRSRRPSRVGTSGFVARHAHLERDATGRSSPLARVAVRGVGLAARTRRGGRRRRSSRRRRAGVFAGQSTPEIRWQQSQPRARGRRAGSRADVDEPRRPSRAGYGCRPRRDRLDDRVGERAAHLRARRAPVDGIGVGGRRGRHRRGGRAVAAGVGRAGRRGRRSCRRVIALAATRCGRRRRGQRARRRASRMRSWSLRIASISASGRGGQPGR